MHQLPCLAMFFVALAGAPAVADTRYVDQNDPDCDDATGSPYCTIQAAIDDAVPGDVIKVYEGVYFEHVVIGVPGIKLKSEDDDEPAIIDGAEGSNSNGVVITIAADDVTVKDLIIRHGEVGVSAHGVHGLKLADNEIRANALIGVAISGTSHEIEDNDIHHNGEGIRLGQGNEASTGCSIEENDVYSHTAIGIVLDNAHGNVVEDNDLDENTVGILLTGGSTTNEIVDNSVKYGSDIGIEAAGGGGNTFKENNVRWYDVNGIHVLTDENHLEENKARNCLKNGIRIDGSFNTLEANKVKFNLKHGYYVDGDDNVLAGNDADTNALNGYRVSGSRNALLGNSAEENQRHGFRICNGGNANELIDNEAEENDNYGFSIHPSVTDTVFMGNECEENNQGGSNPAGLCSIEG